MTPDVHRRFLDYRETFVYFGRGDAVRLDAAAFALADAEHRALLEKGDARSPDEEDQFRRLARLLFRD